ncbi:MAG: flagellin [Pseudomonadota bacterium]
MPVTTVGDMAQQFTAQRNTGAIKSDLARLADSLSSGKVADISAALEGETARFSGIKYTLTQLDGYQQIGSETQQYLQNVQIVLSKVDATRNLTAERLLLVNEASTIAQVDEAAGSARSAFETVVRTLNTQVADRALLGGADVDGPPLATAQAMLADIQTAIGGATDLATIVTAVETWFDDPAGGFATLGYQGDTGALVQKRVSETQTVTMTARADDPAIREVMKGTVLAALAADLPGITQEVKTDLLQDAGQRLFVASSDLVAVQARVGFSEAEVAQAITENAAQQTTLGIAQNDLITADPFETATRLQAVQLQLETAFSVTARLSQLSLTRFI